jgi:hypothetical protein
MADDINNNKTPGFPAGNSPLERFNLENVEMLQPAYCSGAYAAAGR